MTSSINQRIYVRCAANQAKSHLDAYFAQRANADGVVRLALRVPLALPGLATEIELKRDVVATVAPEPVLPPGALDARRVTWEPAGGGPFPRFDGTLSALYDETYESVGLSLAGGYTPPLSTAGAVFDSVLGHRIATATARALLHEVGAALELAFRRTEAAKAAERARITRRPSRDSAENLV